LQFNRVFSAQIFRETRYLIAAEKAATFIQRELWDGSILIRNYRLGPSRISGFSDDYTFLIAALIDLYEASLNKEWLQWALDLQARLDFLFWDTQRGGYYTSTGTDASVVLRMKEDHDGAEPSNQSIATLNLLRLSHFTNNREFREKAEKTLLNFKPAFDQPIAVPMMTAALDLFLSTPKMIIVAGKKDAEDTSLLLKEVWNRFLPNKVLILADGEKSVEFFANLEVMKEMAPIQGKATAFVCEDNTCQLPVTDPASLGKLLDAKKN